MSTARQRRNAQSSPNTISAYLYKHGYRMGSSLGEGSYSKVKLCTRYFSDGTSAYRLACKIINKKKASEDFVLKFLPRELEIVSRIEHPNIVRVFDIVEFDEHVYIFMDCCDKGDLLEYVKSRGMISEDRTRHYYKQIVSAIEYLHKLDIAHRDLKCENVLMAPQDQIKISDFGFSRYCRDAKGRRVLSNTYCGSAAYAAPEILQGTHYNPKLYDTWSLGCVLFIMLTGHMPYDESDIPKMLRNQLDRVLVYPALTEEKISAPAKNLVRRLLEPDTLRRANIEQAKCHEWVGPLDYYEAGDGASVGKENLVPADRARSDNGSSSSSAAQHMAVAGDHGLSGISKLGSRSGRVKPEHESASPSPKNSPRKPGSIASKSPGFFHTTAPATPASRNSTRSGQVKSLKHLPLETQTTSASSSRKPEPSRSRYRSAMSGVTNLFNGTKTGSRSSRADVE